MEPPNTRPIPALAVLALFVAGGVVPAAGPEIVSLEKIWDRAPHNAFTDLIRFEGQWLCVFREGEGHAGGADGKIRVISSPDGRAWQSAALVAEEGVDLRDPKVSIMPDGGLMLVAGGSIFEDDRYLTRAPRVAFSPDGCSWTPTRKVLAEDHWLWRVTWHNGWAYSVSKMGEGSNPRRGILYRSRDGLDWQWITEFRLPAGTWNASETTLRFLPDEQLVALVRPHWIGTSRPPYREWSWTKMEQNIGGPNFIRLPDGRLWAAARRYLEGGERRTVLARLTPTSYEPVLTLPSGGDTSYPGMVWHDGLLWMSYYSSHEGKTSIYLAKIGLPQ
jgi:hypothetical protein